MNSESVWKVLLREAKTVAAKERILSKVIAEYILDRENLDRRSTIRDTVCTDSTYHQKMFGFSKSLKSLNMPQTIIAKTNQEGTRKRFAQVVNREKTLFQENPRKKPRKF